MPGRANVPWFRLPKGAVHEDLSSLTRGLWTQDGRGSANRTECARWLSLFSDKPITGLGLTRRHIAARLGSRPLTRNVCRSVGKTIEADINGQKPAVRFLTDGADWTVRQRCAALQRFADGLACDIGLVEKHAAMVQDGIAIGSGMLWVDADFAHSRVLVDRVMRWEILVDEADARLGEPMCIHRIQAVDRYVLASLYPEREAEIMRAPSASALDTPMWSEASGLDFVRVATSVRRPTSPGAKDGRYVVTIETATLVDEVWTRPHFPLAKFDFDREPLGYWGIGVCEQLEGRQLAIVDHQRMMRNTMRGAAPLLIVDEDANIEPSHVTNVPWTQIKKSGNGGVQCFNPTALNPDVFRYEELQVTSAFQDLQASQLSGRGMKPVGADSGVALREYKDSTSFAQIKRAQRAEGAYVDAMMLVLEACSEIAERNGSDALTATYRSEESVETIRWADVSMGMGDFRIEAHSSALLPREPGARYQMATELHDSGAMTMDTYLDVIGLSGDVRAAMQGRMSQRDCIEKVLSRMLDSGESEYPDPVLDLGLQLSLALERYAYGVAHAMPEERLQMLRDWMTNVRAEQGRLAPPAPAQAAPQPGPMPGPMPGPVPPEMMPS